jgi:hypothetical protein
MKYTGRCENDSNVQGYTCLAAVEADHAVADEARAVACAPRSSGPRKLLPGARGAFPVGIHDGAYILGPKNSTRGSRIAVAGAVADEDAPLPDLLAPLHHRGDRHLGSGRVVASEIEVPRVRPHRRFRNLSIEVPILLGDPV